MTQTCPSSFESQKINLEKIPLYKTSTREQNLYEWSRPVLLLFCVCITFVLCFGNSYVQFLKTPNSLSYRMLRKAVEGCGLCLNLRKKERRGLEVSQGKYKRTA